MLPIDKKLSPARLRNRSKIPVTKQYLWTNFSDVKWTRMTSFTPYFHYTYFHIEVPVFIFFLFCLLRCGVFQLFLGILYTEHVCPTLCCSYFFDLLLPRFLILFKVLMRLFYVWTSSSSSFCIIINAQNIRLQICKLSEWAL